MLCILVMPYDIGISIMVLQRVEAENDHDYRVYGSGGMYYWTGSPDGYPGPAS